MRKALLIFVFLSCLCLYLCRQPSIEEIKMYLDKCSKENHLSMAMLNTTELLPDVKDVKCFIKCMMQETDTMKQDGEINEDALERNMAAFNVTGEMKEDLEGCIKEESEDVCDKAYKIYKCSYEKLQQKY